MTNKKHNEYDDSIDEYTLSQIEYIFVDIHEELDNIEKTLDTEASKILLHWVRDSIQRVSENYQR